MKSLQSSTKLTSSKDMSSYELLQMAGSIGMWEVDFDSNILHWSDTTKAIHEVDLLFEPEISQAINFYKEGFHRDKVTKDFNTAVNEGIEFDSEYLIITGSGKEKWVRSVGVPVFKKGVCKKVYGVFQDIDDNKRSKLLASLHQENFKQTFEYAPIGKALVSLEGNLIKSNLRLTEILGYSPEELSKITFQQITHPEDLKIDVELVTKLVQGVDDHYQIEKRFIHKNGSTICCILSVSIVKQRGDIPSYFISQITDINDLKNAKEKIEGLLKESQFKNEKLLNFKHIVSHNLRSHTSNLDMLIRFLEQDVREVQNTEVFGLLKEAFSNLTSTIRNLSEISDFENCCEDDFETVNLGEEVKRSIYNVKALLEDVGGEIKIINKANVKLSVIPEYLKSSFLNIITNSIKYREPNRALRLKIIIDKQEDYATISFKDNGLGINLDLHSEKIFGMYKTFHRHPDSRGLGLFIVKNQIEAMQGKITVESQVGIGSTFKIYLKR